MEPEFYFQGDKTAVYRQLLPELEALVEGVPYRVSILANAASALRQAFGFFWVGFYLAGDDETLHVGPFQGDVACMLIRKGRGVCGTAWATGETQVVPDVEQFPGHIACSSRSRSVAVSRPTGIPVRADTTQAMSEAVTLRARRFSAGLDRCCILSRSSAAFSNFRSRTAPCSSCSSSFRAAPPRADCISSILARAAPSSSRSMALSGRYRSGRYRMDSRTDSFRAHAMPVLPFA